MTDRHPRRHRVGLRICSTSVLLLLLAGCGGPYNDLARDFTAQGEPTGVEIDAARVVMVSRKHRGAYTFGGLRVFLSESAVELRPRSTYLGLLKKLRLPADGVSGCSMTCFGGKDRHADLVFGPQEAEVSFDASSEIVDWCWQNELPMLSGAQERGWLYEGRSLPSKADYEPVTRDEYEQQANRTCMGY